MATKEDKQLCLCDKVYRTTHEVCEPALKQICKAVDCNLDPEFLYEGKSVSANEALTIATEILSEACYPLLLGIDKIGVSNQKKAIDLFKVLGGVVDPGASQYSLPRVGAVRATFGEIRQRSECVILLNCQLWDLKPRLFKTLKEADNRKIVWIGDRSCPVDMCDDSIITSGDCLEELVSALIATFTGAKVRQPKLDALDIVSTIAGQKPNEILTSFVEEITAKSYVSIFHQDSCESQFNVLGDLIVLFVKKLNSKTRAIAMEVPKLAHETSASDVLSWATGFGNPVDVSGEIPKSFNDEYSSRHVIRRQECDAVMAFGNSVLFQFDEIKKRHLESLPKILFQWAGTEGASTVSTLEIRNLSLLGDTFSRMDDLTFQVVDADGRSKLSSFLVQLLQNIRTVRSQSA